MAKTYYSGLNDTNLAKDVIAKEPDLYIQKREYSGTGVYAIETGGVSTLTPSVSPSWTINEFASTVADNLLVYDGNSLVASAKIVANTADAITFDETTLLLESDGVTPATLVVGTSYSFKVYTPSSISGNTYGPYFGLVEGAELNINDTFMKFKKGTPKKLLFKDLEEREGQITGGHVNFTNKEVAETILGAAEYGSQTGQESIAIGSNPDTNLYYRLTFVGQDRDNRVLVAKARETQFEVSGNLFNKAESGHYMAPFTADIIADAFYPDTADMVGVVRVD